MSPGQAYDGVLAFLLVLGVVSAAVEARITRAP